MFMTLARDTVAPAFSRGPSLLTRFARVVAREIRIRRDMRLLASLDEAALHDIGLTGGGLEDAVRHGRDAGLGAVGLPAAHICGGPNSLLRALWR